MCALLIKLLGSLLAPQFRYKGRRIVKLLNKALVSAPQCLKRPWLRSESHLRGRSFYLKSAVVCHAKITSIRIYNERPTQGHHQNVRAFFPNISNA